MLVPQEAPCPDCGHARRDHEFTMEVAAERCIHCGCTVEVIPVLGMWNPNAEPRGFDWAFALGLFVLTINSEESLFSDTIGELRPGFVFAPGEQDDLRTVELIVRDLWSRYAPPKPKPASMTSRDVAAENAGVDRYEEEKRRLASVLLTLAVNDEWRLYFPAVEHEKVEAARRIIIAHGGDRIES